MSESKRSIQEIILKPFGDRKAKRNNAEIRYYSKKEYKKQTEGQEPVIIGATKLKAYDKENNEKADFICKSGSQEFEGRKRYFGFVKGYFQCSGKNTFMEYKSNFLLFIILIGIALTIGISALFLWSSSPVDVPQPTENITVVGDDWNGQLPANGEQSGSGAQYMEIPGYSNLLVTKDNPYIELINIDENPVYLKYTISEGDKVLYKSDYIKPNGVIQWDASGLSVGTHNTTFQIDSVLIDGQTSGNSAVQEVSIRVEG